MNPARLVLEVVPNTGEHGAGREDWLLLLDGEVVSHSGSRGGLLADLELFRDEAYERVTFPLSFLAKIAADRARDALPVNGEYRTARACVCGQSHLGRDLYWSHRLDAEAAAEAAGLPLAAAGVPA